jgi:hypothetical protein
MAKLITITTYDPSRATGAELDLILPVARIRSILDTHTDAGEEVRAVHLADPDEVLLSRQSLNELTKTWKDALDTESTV